MTKALNIIVTTVFATAFFAVVGLFLASILPIPGKVDIKIVKSGSMEPTIATGGIVVIQPSFAKATEGKPAYQVGDVITFGKDSKTEVPTTHRIIEVTTQSGATYFVTKGDANEEKDPQLVAESTVIGKVLFSAPFVGYVLDFAKQPLGFALMIVIPAVLIILYELIGIITEVRRMFKKDTTGTAKNTMGPYARSATKDVGREVYDIAFPILDLRDQGNPNILNLRIFGPSTHSYE